MPRKEHAPPAVADRARGDAWTTRRLLEWMSRHFAGKSIESPRVVAEMLLSHVIGCERIRLYTDIDRPASEAELVVLRELTARASKHEPVQYLVGHAWFFSRQFDVSRSTLIPRPCTEVLVEQVLRWIRLQPDIGAPAIAELGTGTGCIGISLAASLPAAFVLVTDVVPEALVLARKNAARHQVESRMEFQCGDGLAALSAGPPGRRFHVIAANLPYIPDHEWADVPPNVKEHEPASALRGGTDGLQFIRPVIEHAMGHLASPGLLALEIAACTRDAALELAKRAGYEHPTVVKDYDDLPRVLLAQRS